MNKFNILWLSLLFPWWLIAAEKVVSLSPALTQLVMMLDGVPSLCGRSSACYFPEVSHLPVVGDLGRPFPEAVLQSGATVVLCDAVHPEANWAVLSRCQVRVERFATGDIGALPENLRRLGRLLGREERAEEAAAEVAAGIARLRSSPPGKPVRAAVLFGVEPVISCGGDVFISDVLHLAGVENIAGNAGQGYFILSVEYLYRENPDWILTIGIPGAVAEQAFRHGLLRQLPAVKNGRIIVLDADRWSRLTPEIINAANELRRRLF